MVLDHGKSIRRAVNAGLAINALLALVKTSVGIVGHSDALLADGVNSTSDVAYYIVVKVFMFFARQPPDRAHPYGHRQFESIAALAVGAFVITTAIALFWDAVNSSYDVLRAASVAPQVRLVALYVSLLTVAVKLVLTLYTRRVADRTRNAAILALARDHRNDIICACGAACGIVLSRIGHPWGDPVAGALVALVVLFTGIQILRESSADLMDAVPGEAVERQTRQVLGALPGVKAVEEVLAHRFGPYLVLNVTIGVDGDVTVTEGDRIASDVESVIMARIGLVRRVYVHYHPVRGDGPHQAGTQRRSGGRGPAGRPDRH